MRDTTVVGLPSQANIALPASIMRALGIAVVLVLFVLIGLRSATPPKPAAADAPADRFSAQRALALLPSIAARPHPIGSAEHARVRAYLLARLEELGLSAQVQTQWATGRGGYARNAGVVSNIIVRLPGHQSGKAVLLVAHYDSVPTSIGAADDGASVAALLETLRALKAGPRLANDVIVLLSDGEEEGLLGAEQFVDAHELSERIGAVLNFEYRGNRGPFLMFETSDGNGALIDALARAAPSIAVGNSIMYEVYKRMPNGTDMTAFKRAGMPGLNFAAIGGQESYHTLLDRPDLISPASVQHEGELMLALAQYFGDHDLSNLQQGNDVYFNLPGLGIVHYTYRLALPLALTTLVFFFFICRAAFINRRIRAGRIALAVCCFLMLLVALPLASYWLWTGVAAFHPEYAVLYQGRPYTYPWYLTGICSLVVGGFILMLSKVHRWCSAEELTVAVLSIWLLLTFGSLALPGTSFLFVWPLFPYLAACCFLWSKRTDPSSAPVRTACGLLAAALGVILVAPFIDSLFESLAPTRVFAGVALLVLLLALNTQLLLLTAHRLVICCLVIGGFVCLLIASVRSGFDDEHPRPNNLLFVQDAEQNRSYWLSSDARLDEWTKGYLGGTPELRPVTDLLGDDPRPFWRAAAPVLPLTAPILQVESDTVDARGREMTLLIRSTRKAQRLTVQVEGATVVKSTVQERDFAPSSQGDWVLNVYNPPDEGVRIVLHIKGEHAFVIRLLDYSYGLPSIDMPSRPRGMMPNRMSGSDSTIVVSRVRVSSAAVLEGQFRNRTRHPGRV